MLNVDTTMFGSMIEAHNKRPNMYDSYLRSIETYLKPTGFILTLHVEDGSMKGLTDRFMDGFS